MCDEIWRKIVEIHGHTKVLTLRAEELDKEQEFFFPPVIQQRDAHDHFMRSKAASLGIKDFPDDEARRRYIVEHLDKALGHEYRAFFDIADWLALIYRSQISDMMTCYSVQAITSVLPSYYPEIVPFVERIHRQIADIRQKKDIGAGDGVLAQVLEYRQLLEQLDDYWGQIAGVQGALKDCQAKLDCSDRKSGLIKVLIALLGAAGGAVLGWMLRRP